MKSLKSLSIISVIFIALFGCKKDKLGPLSYNGTAPGPISNVTVLNQAGQATLTYTLPRELDLSYVKAVYTLASGVQREVKSSFYTNKLVLDGFGDTLEHEVKVYAVNKSEVSSEPLTVKIRPLENSIWETFRSLKVIPDFAGINIQAKNKAKADIAIIPMRKVGYKGWVQIDGIYTSSDSVNRDIRGLDTIPLEVAVVVRDRFLNHTDTLFTTVKPLYETPLSKSLYKTMNPVIWPGDQSAHYSASGSSDTGIHRMWDGETVVFPSCAYTPANITDAGPHSITFDIGQLAQLSRIVIWDYPETINGLKTWFYRGDMKNFEIWGSADPNPDGSWDSWVKLGTYESVKPSGLPGYGDLSAEDRDIAAAGFSWKFRIDVPKLRYLRIKCINNWMGTQFLMITEVQVYGNPH